MTKSTTVGLITFGVFMTEAVVHYNIGVNSGKPKADKKFIFPPTDDFVKAMLVVGMFSVANAILIKKLTS